MILYSRSREMITKEQYECAKHTVQFYNRHKSIKLYMDDVEKQSLKKALEIIEEYQKQIWYSKEKEIQEKTK